MFVIRKKIVEQLKEEDGVFLSISLAFDEVACMLLGHISKGPFVCCVFYCVLFYSGIANYRLSSAFSGCQSPALPITPVICSPPWPHQSCGLLAVSWATWVSHWDGGCLGPLTADCVCLL